MFGSYFCSFCVWCLSLDIFFLFLCASLGFTIFTFISLRIFVSEVVSLSVLWWLIVRSFPPSHPISFSLSSYLSLPSLLCVSAPSPSFTWPEEHLDHADAVSPYWPSLTRVSSPAAAASLTVEAAACYVSFNRFCSVALRSLFAV